MEQNVVTLNYNSKVGGGSIRDIVQIMEIIEQRKNVTVEEILELLDSPEYNRRWVVHRANNLCRQYPLLFEPIIENNRQKGFRFLK